VYCLYVLISSFSNKFSIAYPKRKQENYLNCTWKPHTNE